MSPTEKALQGMLDSDQALYEKCLATTGFAYHFNQLARLAAYDRDGTVHYE